MSNQPMTEERLQEMERREEALPEGPWTWEIGNGPYCQPSYGSLKSAEGDFIINLMCISCGGRNVSDVNDLLDDQTFRSFLEHVLTDLQDLREALRTAWGEVTELKELLRRDKDGNSNV